MFFLKKIYLLYSSGFVLHAHTKSFLSIDNNYVFEHRQELFYH